MRARERDDGHPVCTSMIVMGTNKRLNVRHSYLKNFWRLTIAGAFFFRAIPASSSVRIVTPSTDPAALIQSVTARPRGSAVVAFAAPAQKRNIVIPTNLTQDDMAYEVLPDQYDAVDPFTKELNFKVFARAQKAIDAVRFNPADWVPYKSLSAGDGANQVASKVLSKTFQTIVNRELADVSLVNLPVIKTASYTKAVQHKNYKISYGVRNTLAETEVDIHKNIKATLSYNVASPEVNFGFNWNF